MSKESKLEKQEHNGIEVWKDQSNYQLNSVGLDNYTKEIYEKLVYIHRAKNLTVIDSLEDYQLKLTVL